MTRRWPLVLLALTALAAGCATGASSPFVSDANPERNLRLVIRNQNFNDATVYAVRIGQRIRLGVVGSNREERFTVRWPSPENFQLLIRLLSGGSCLTQPIPAQPGDQIFMEIAPSLETSPDCIR